ncbi:hypothetical protein MTO96_032707 [Rhipicephalus appendiculatus]
MPTKGSGNLKFNSQLYADNDKLQRGLNLKALDLLEMAFTPADNTGEPAILGHWLRYRGLHQGLAAA